MNRIRTIQTAVILTAVFLSFLLAAGCTERERRGFSSIPQNSPSGWELTPYGNAHN